MQDLNSIMFYKAKFRIEAKEPDKCDLLWKLILEIRLWMIGKKNRYEKVIDPSMPKWTKFKTGSKFYDMQKNNTVYAESLYHESKEDEEEKQVSWACKIVEKQDNGAGVAPREWVTEIGYQSIGLGSAEISYVVSYSDVAGFIGPCAEVPSISVPKVVRNIVNSDELICTIGEDIISTQPRKLSAGEFPEFEKTLFSSKREIPIVYISPKRLISNQDEAGVLVSPEEMAQSVAANALVFYSEDLSFSSEMRYMNKGNYNCTGGMIRLYLPHIDASDEYDQYRHRFLTAQYIEEKGSEYVLNIFRRALAQDFHYYESMFRLDDCRILVESDKNQAYIKSILDKSEDDISEAEKAYIEESDLRKERERSIRELKEQLDKLKKEKYNLEYQNELLTKRAERFSEIEQAHDAARNIEEYPNNALKIAKYFSTVYPDRITFSERGYRSLEECNTKSELLWEVFYHIAIDLYDLMKNEPAQAFHEFTEQTGWECARGEGRMTRNDAKLMKQYVDTYEGQEIDIQAHIKNGKKESDSKFVRVYFAYDPMITDKIIIGHCGKHLDNYSTKKIQ